MPRVPKPSSLSQTTPADTFHPAILALANLPSRKSKWLEANQPGPNASELHRVVFAELAGWHLWTPRNGSTWKDYAVEVLGAMVRRDLSHLERLGNAVNPNAIELFATVADQMVQTLNGWVGGKHQPVLERVARKRVAWPMRVAKRKVFGDDIERLKAELPIGRDTIAADPNARFNPASKFGGVAFELLNRIEHWRTLTPQTFWFPSFPNWAHEARELPPFSRKASPAEKAKWRAVVEKILDEDFKDPELLKSYRALVSAPSHQRRWKSVFRDKIRLEFDSLWGMNR